MPKKIAKIGNNQTKISKKLKDNLKRKKMEYNDKNIATSKQTTITTMKNFFSKK